jgi:hypothetical protein
MSSVYGSAIAVTAHFTPTVPHTSSMMADDSDIYEGEAEEKTVSGVLHMFASETNLTNCADRGWIGKTPLASPIPVNFACFAHSANTRQRTRGFINSESATESAISAGKCEVQ